VVPPLIAVPALPSVFPCPFPRSSLCSYVYSSVEARRYAKVYLPIQAADGFLSTATCALFHPLSFFCCFPGFPHFSTELRSRHDSLFVPAISQLVTFTIDGRPNLVPGSIRKVDAFLFFHLKESMKEAKFAIRYLC
jgi:hypothetical protein